MMANDKLIYASDARRAILKEDPTLAYCIDNIKGVDAVEVVRCKDCKYWINAMKPLYCSKMIGDCIVDDEPVDRWEHDFCSYGERREENG